MKNVVSHIRVFVLRGLLATIPFALCLLALQFFYVVIDKRLMNLVDKYVGYRIPGLGILLLMVFLYFVGLFVSNVIGRRILHLVDFVFVRIPILKAIYQIGKQVSSSFSLTENQVFKKAVLVDVHGTGVWLIGFVTGPFEDNRSHRHDKMHKVFIPTVPNPTTGFVIFVKEAEMIDTQWTIDEAMKMVISGGIIGPEKVS